LALAAYRVLKIMSTTPQRCRKVFLRIWHFQTTVHFGTGLTPPCGVGVSVGRMSVQSVVRTFFGSEPLSPYNVAGSFSISESHPLGRWLFVLMGLAFKALKLLSSKHVGSFYLAISMKILGGHTQGHIWVGVSFLGLYIGYRRSTCLSSEDHPECSLHVFHFRAFFFLVASTQSTTRYPMAGIQ